MHLMVTSLASIYRIARNRHKFGAQFDQMSDDIVIAPGGRGCQLQIFLGPHYFGPRYLDRDVYKLQMHS